MKRIAKTIALSTLIACLLTMPVNGQPMNTEVKVVVNGVEQQYEAAPIIQNGRVLVPLRGIFEDLGTLVEWEPTTKTINASKGQTKLIIKIGSSIASINGKPIYLDVAPVIIDGRTRVPLRFVSESLGAEVEWQSDVRTVNITAKIEQKNSSQTKVNEIQQKNMLTYEKAVEMALAVSLDLKNKEQGLKKAEELSNNLYLTPGTYNPGLIQGKKGLEISEKWAEKQVDITKETIAFQVKNAIKEISLLDEELLYTDKKIESLKAKKDISEIKAKSGLESEYNLSIVKKDYEQELKQKAVLLKSIENAYVKLNKLIGVGEKERYVFEDMIAYTPMGSVDIDDITRKMFYEDPYIWFQEKQIESAELGVKLYEYNAQDDPYKVKEINVITAKNTLANMKLKLEESLRLKYNQIRQLEDSYKILQINLEKAEKGLKLLQTQYEVGMVIEAQLLEAEVALEKINYEMKKIASQHENLVTLLKRPYLAPDYL